MNEILMATKIKYPDILCDQKVKNEDLSKAYIYLMEKFEIMDVMEELEKP